MQFTEDGERRADAWRSPELRALVCLIGLVFFVGPLMAPWGFWAVQGTDGSALGAGGMGDVPFHRYVHRSMIAGGLVLAWVLRKPMGIVSWSRLGFGRDKRGWVQGGIGFSLGLISMGLIAGLALATGAREMRPNMESIVAYKIVSAATAALAVGLLEEVLFRGMLMGTLRRGGLEGGALVLSSGVYAWMHFLGRPDPPESILWNSGWGTLWQMAGGLVAWRELIPGLASLFLAGMILGWSYLRTGSLYLSIGLHAGWVFWMKLYGATTQASGAGAAWFWGRGKMYDGWLCLVVLGMFYGGCLLWERRMRHGQRRG